MLIRPIEPKDIPALHQIYLDQGFDYAEPDWSKTIGGVLVDEFDQVQIFLVGRPTVEMYAGVSKQYSDAPGMKAEQFKRLDRAVVEQLRAKGYEDQHSWIPPKCRSFVRRLMKELGWVRTDGEGGFVGLLRWIG